MKTLVKCYNIKLLLIEILQLYDYDTIKRFLFNCYTTKLTSIKLFSNNDLKKYLQLYFKNVKHQMGVVGRPENYILM